MPSADECAILKRDIEAIKRYMKVIARQQVNHSKAIAEFMTVKKFIVKAGILFLLASHLGGDVVGPVLRDSIKKMLIKEVQADVKVHY